MRSTILQETQSRPRLNAIFLRSTKKLNIEYVYGIYKILKTMSMDQTGIPEPKIAYIISNIKTNYILGN